MKMIQPVRNVLGACVLVAMSVLVGCAATENDTNSSEAAVTGETVCPTKTCTMPANFERLVEGIYRSTKIQSFLKSGGGGEPCQQNVFRKQPGADGHWTLLYGNVCYRGDFAPTAAFACDANGCKRENSTSTGTMTVQANGTVLGTDDAKNPQGIFHQQIDQYTFVRALGVGEIQPPNLLP